MNEAVAITIGLTVVFGGLFLIIFFIVKLARRGRKKNDRPKEYVQEFQAPPATAQPDAFPSAEYPAENHPSNPQAQMDNTPLAVTPNPNTKLCKFCRTAIDKKAKVCPTCLRPQKSHGCLITVVAILIFICVAVIIIFGPMQMNKDLQRSVSGVSDDSQYITMSEYNQIKTGMTYEEVINIVGSPGEVSIQSESGGFNLTMITWYGNGTAGSNANVSFQNGKVMGKAQVGLR